MVYIGETGRQFKTRLVEHKKDVTDNTKGVITRATRTSITLSDFQHKSVVTDHMIKLNHTPDWRNTETHRQKRQIQEAIAIRRHNKNMNREEGDYKLSNIYNQLIDPENNGRGRQTTSGAANSNI